MDIPYSLGPITPRSVHCRVSVHTFYMIYRVVSSTDTVRPVIGVVQGENVSFLAASRRRRALTSPAGRTGASVVSILALIDN